MRSAEVPAASPENVPPRQPAAERPIDSASEPAARDPHRQAVLVLLALGVTLLLVHALAAPIVALAFRSTDDSYYYFNVARNIVLGHGATFDGINQTNGFHPLWMLVILPIFGALPEDPLRALRGVYCLIAVLAGITGWLAWRVSARTAGGAAGLLVLPLLAIPVFLNPLLNGLETGLLILMLFALMLAAERYELLALAAPAPHNLLLGALLAGVFLARVDSVFIVAAVFGAILVRGLSSPATRAAAGAKLIVLGGAFGALVLPYFTWNLMSFGHLIPISGDLKSSFPRAQLQLQDFHDIGALAGVASLLFSTISLPLLMRWSRSPRAQQPPRIAIPQILVPIWVGCVFHFLHTVLFMRWGTHWWHYSAYGPLAVVLLVAVFAALQKRVPGRPVLAILFAGLVVAAALGTVFDMRLRGEGHRAWYTSARWARDHLPEDAVIGMRECGLFGYFCGRPTVNLDGVINGYDYQEALRDHRLRAYLAACHITHIADFRARYENGRFVIALPANLYGEPGGAIVAPREAEIHASEEYGTPSDRTSRAPGSGGFRVAIWDVRKVEIVDDARSLSRRPAPHATARVQAAR